MTTISTRPDTPSPTSTLRIAGERRTTGTGGVYEHLNPSTGEVDSIVPLAGASDVDEAVRCAHSTFATWKDSPALQRQTMLLALADLMEANAAEFGRLGAIENGTPVLIGATLVGKAAEWVRYYAGWPDRLEGRVTSTYGKDGSLAYTVVQPIGVIGAVITWNGPLMSLAMKVPAAVAAGNTVVVKPSELTPYTSELFADLAEQAGFPPGVLQIVPGGAEAGSALVSHPLVKKVSFTGGPDTARAILHACAENMTPAVLELGGKSANIILDDADLDMACNHGVFMGIGLLSGQGCAFPSRMLVHSAIYDEVIERISAIAKTIVVGDPLEPGTMSGPVVSRASFDRIMGIIGRAEKDGARLLTGGAPVENPVLRGHFVQPTIFVDVDPDSELAQTEVFGPVLAVIRFESDAEAIEIANNSRYGLSGYVQTRNLRRAQVIAERIVTGEVLVNGAVNLAANRPFGGGGLSGFGKEGGPEGIFEFLSTKSVAFA